MVNRTAMSIKLCECGCGEPAIAGDAFIESFIIVGMECQALRSMQPTFKPVGAAQTQTTRTGRTTAGGASSSCSRALSSSCSCSGIAQAHSTLLTASQTMTATTSRETCDGPQRKSNRLIVAVRRNLPLPGTNPRQTPANATPSRSL